MLRAALWALLALTGSALAGSPATWAGEIDGLPTWITVVPQGHDIDPDALEGEPWWRWGNVTTDAYLFAFEQPDAVRLIVDFEPLPQGELEARLYVDRTDPEVAAPLDYRLDGDDLEVRTHGGNPYVTLRSHGGGWTIDGATNYDLTLTEDYQDCGSAVLPDGEIDWLVEVRAAEPGVPAWQTERKLTDRHPSRGCSRFGANVRMPDSGPFLVAGGILPDFPYLGVGTTPSHWETELPNPLHFTLPNPRSRYLMDVSSFVSFQEGGSYVVNSLLQPPEANFESPFAFYNFDPESRSSEMVVRGGGFRVGDPLGPLPNNVQRNIIRYSWKLPDEASWRYGLHLAGFHRFEEPFTIGDVTVNLPSGPDFPSWVVDRDWPFVVFIDAVAPYSGSEGIYFYQLWDDDLWDWLNGATDEQPYALEAPYLPEDRALTRISWEGVPPAFRGEYSAAHFRQPLLYFSPVDNRLHLEYARGGVWNLEGGRLLRVHNFTGGAHVEGWTRERIDAQPEAEVARALTQAIEEQLYVLGDVVIYAGPDRFEFRRASHDAAAFTLLPPTDAESWRAFGARMAPLEEAARDPEDLAGWLQALTGPALTVDGASISGFDANPARATFVLTLDRGATIAGDPELLAGFPDLGAGPHVVTLDLEAGTWTSAPATDPSLSAHLRADLHQFRPGNLEIDLINDGSVGWRGQVEVSVDGVPVDAWTDLAVGGDSTRTLFVPWVTRVAGSYAVDLALDGAPIALGSIEVTPTPRVGTGAALALSMQRSPVIVLLVLAMVALAVAGSWTAWWRT